MKKIVGIILATLLVFVAVFSFGSVKKAYAMSASVGISDPGRPEPGQQFTVNYSVTGSDNMAISVNVSVSGGTIVGGNPSIYDDNCTSSSFGGSIAVVSSSDAPVTITVSGYVVGLTDAGRCDVWQQRVVPIHTYAEIEAEQAIAASQAQVDESIRAEQNSKAASEAAIQNSIDASIAESVSIAESISQSEYDSSVEESISIREESESISAVEKTRAFEMYDNYFVPFEITRRISGNFYFATVDTPLLAPENYKAVELIRNEQAVWACQNTSMSNHVYLVYGTTDESKEPGFYFYDSYTDTFFDYEMLTGEEIVTEFVETETEPETEMETEEEPVVIEKNTGIKPWVPVVIGVLAFILGILAAFVFMIFKNKNNGPKGGAGSRDSFGGSSDSSDGGSDTMNFEIEDEDAGIPISETVVE